MLYLKPPQLVKHFTRLYQQKSYPSQVTIVEVGPRDGLQNEKVNKNCINKKLNLILFKLIFNNLPFKSK